MKVKVKEKKEGKQKKTKRKEKTFIGEAPPPEIQFVWYILTFSSFQGRFRFFCAIDNCRQYLRILA